VRFKGPGGGLGFQRDDKNSVAITFVPVPGGSKPHALSMSNDAGAHGAALDNARNANVSLVLRQNLDAIAAAVNRQ
jgi:hypothetical protein